MRKLLLTFLAGILSFPFFAFEYNGINYKLTSRETVAVGVNTDVSGNVVIPETVAYQGKSYTVTSIGELAFYNCSEMISMEIPATVTSIEANAFASCTGLISVKIPNSVTSLDYGAFYYCTSLQNVEIPASVNFLGHGAFWHCSSLESVRIPSSVTSIGYGNFCFCENLTSIIVDDGNPSYTSLDGTLYSKNIETIICRPAGLGGSFRIPNSVTTIGDKAFAGSRIESIEIPSSVTSLGLEAFSFCSKLKSVEIPGSVTFIGQGCFMNCSSMTSIMVESGNPTYSSLEGVLYFKNFEKIICYPAGLGGSFEIPNTVTNIDNYAFFGCGNLTNVVIPPSVVSIGMESFASTGLTRVEIPNSVTSLGLGAFEDTNLRSVIIGKNISELDIFTFSSCPNLTEIYCLPLNPPDIWFSCFDMEAYETATLYVPEISLAKYQSTFIWDYFHTIKTLEDSEVKKTDMDAPEVLENVYELNGRLVKNKASQRDIDALNPGIYIIGSKKVIIK